MCSVNLAAESLLIPCRSQPPVSNEHHQGMVYVQAQAANGVPGLEDAGVLDEGYGPLAADPESGGDGHGFAFP